MPIAVAALQSNRSSLRLQPFVDLVKSAKFIELPDDQLARRLFYNRHIHAIWKHSDTLYVQRTVECGVNTEFRIECIQCNNERVVSEDLLQSFSDIRQHHTKYILGVVAV